MLDACLAFVDLDRWWNKSWGSGCPASVLPLRAESHMSSLVLDSRTVQYGTVQCRSSQIPNPPSDKKCNCNQPDHHHPAIIASSECRAWYNRLAREFPLRCRHATKSRHTTDSLLEDFRLNRIRTARAILGFVSNC